MRRARCEHLVATGHAGGHRTQDARVDRGLPEIDAGQRSVLRAMGEGLTDEAGARRVGVSLRTYRRRVAELLAALGSGSRFQAGVRAGGLGLIR